GGGRGTGGPAAAAARAGTGGPGARRGARAARPADGRGPGRGASRRRGRLRAGSVPGAGRAMGGRLPGGRSVRGLLPSPFRARRCVTAQTDRPRGPDRGGDRTRCTGDRRDAAMSRRGTAVRRPADGGAGGRGAVQPVPSRKRAQLPGEKASAGPAGFLESRTASSPAQGPSAGRAVSTQLLAPVL